jgi:hypothetical protein
MKKINLPTDPERIIKIDPDGKYLVIMPEGTTWAKMWNTSAVLDSFMQNARTFFVAPHDIVIVRIKDGEAEVLYQSKETSEAASDSEADDDGETEPEMHGSPQDVP